MSEDEGEKEIELFAEHARWLINFHDTRSESICARAVALFAFVGVILALLIGSGLPGEVKVDWFIRVPFLATVGFLILTSAYCLITLRHRLLEVAGVGQTRRNWRRYVTKERRGKTASDITESLLRAKELDEASTVDWVLRTADARAAWFGKAVWSMGLSLVSLTVLLIVVGFQVYL
ncbi:hypothetical protein [Nocardioides marinquilinus]|uniref:hypothetical protein n=1 Tax=Nocardioides marinquilinus TaxID=1210400 RepID=UPI0031E9EA81